MNLEMHTLPCDDAAEMERFLNALQPRLYGLARRMVREPEAAADVVQNSFEKVLRCCRQFEDTSCPSTWVFRIVVNESLQWLRGAGRRTKRHVDPAALDFIASSLPAPDDDAAARQERGRVHAALARLDQEDRELLGAVVEGKTLKSLTKRFGLSLAGVKTRAFRARRKLARELAGDETSRNREIAPRRRALL